MARQVFVRLPRVCFQIALVTVVAHIPRWKPGRSAPWPPDGNSWPTGCPRQEKTEGENIFQKKFIQGTNDSLAMLKDCTYPVYSSAHKNMLGINIHVSRF